VCLSVISSVNHCVRLVGPQAERISPMHFQAGHCTRQPRLALAFWLFMLILFCVIVSVCLLLCLLSL